MPKEDDQRDVQKQRRRKRRKLPENAFSEEETLEPLAAPEFELSELQRGQDPMQIFLHGSRPRAKKLETAAGKEAQAARTVKLEIAAEEVKMESTAETQELEAAPVAKKAEIRAREEKPEIPTRQEKVQASAERNKREVAPTIEAAPKGNKSPIGSQRGISHFVFVPLWYVLLVMLVAASVGGLIVFLLSN